MASQPVAPQATLAVLQAVVPLQQLPVPASPQVPEVQASFSVQAPVACCAVQVPALHQNPVVQSLLTAHAARQLAASAQIRWFGHGAGASTVHTPLPLQVVAVRVFPVQLPVPQEVAEVG